MALVEGVEVDERHLIGGERVPSPTTFEDRSPLDWSWKLADIARGDAATAARRGDRRGRSRSGRGPTSGPAGRAEHLHRLADLIDAHTEDIAIVETVDMGMLHESMRARLVARGAVNFRTYADLAASLRGARSGRRRARATPSCGCRPGRPSSSRRGTRRSCCRRGRWRRRWPPATR